MGSAVEVSFDSFTVASKLTAAHLAVQRCAFVAHVRGRGCSTLLPCPPRTPRRRCFPILRPMGSGRVPEDGPGDALASVVVAACCDARSDAKVINDDDFTLREINEVVDTLLLSTEGDAHSVDVLLLLTEGD
eukprot:IDg21605t1